MCDKNMQGFCDKTSNNKYFNCPPMMADGRHFTDYRPNSYSNNLIRMSSNIVGSYEYRQYLIHNAEKLMQENRNHATQKNSCSVSTTQKCNAEEVPFQRQCNVTLNNMECNVVNPQGVGTNYRSALN
jgi:hypothetical protein